MTRKILIITGVSINIILFANSLSAVFIKSKQVNSEYIQEKSSETENTDQKSNLKQLVEFDQFFHVFDSEKNISSLVSVKLTETKNIVFPLIIREVTTPPPDFI